VEDTDPVVDEDEETYRERDRDAIVAIEQKIQPVRESLQPKLQQ
jgi:hypothetical protein